MNSATSLSRLVQQRFPQHVLATHQYRGDDTVILKREGLLEVGRFLRDDPESALNFLMDLSCADYLTFGKAAGSAPRLNTPSPLPYFMTPKPSTETWDRVVGQDYRFEVVYHLYSLTKNHRLRVKVPLTDAEPALDSVASLWAAANWYEREAWDMFGIRFNGHPNLRRILMYEEFQGHPLRKDYPIYKRQPLIGPVSQEPAAPRVPIIVGMNE